MKFWDSNSAAATLANVDYTEDMEMVSVRSLQIWNLQRVLYLTDKNNPLKRREDSFATTKTRKWREMIDQ